MGACSSMVRESSSVSARLSAEAEAEEKQVFEALIRRLDAPPLLNVEESAAYIVRKLAGNIILRRGVKCLLRDTPADPVKWLVAFLSQAQSCGVPPADAQKTEDSESNKYDGSTNSASDAIGTLASIRHGVLQHAVAMNDDSITRAPLRPSGWVTADACGAKDELQHAPMSQNGVTSQSDRDAELALGIAFERAQGHSSEQQMALYNEHLGGKIIDKRFKVLYTLGVGGFGAVFACSDLRITRKVAIKLNFELVVSGMAGNSNSKKENSEGHEELRRTFFREGIVLARLEHPSILKIFHFGETATSLLYQIMELIGGGSLKDYLAEFGRMDPIRTVSIVRCILLALSHAHEKGVVHLDLKPANILLTDNNRGAKVIDWGSAQWTFKGLEGPSGADVMPDQDHDIQSDETAGVTGTPAYMSFEQIRKFLDDNLNVVLDHRSDLFTVGLIIFECSTGKVLRRQYEQYTAWVNSFVAYTRAPDDFDGQLQQRKNKVLQETELLQQWQFPKADLNDRVVQFLNKALAINPESRFASAKDMLRVFELSDPSNELPTVILDELESVTMYKSTCLDLSTHPDLSDPQWRRLFSHITDLPHLQTVIGRPGCCPQYDFLCGETKAQLTQLSQREEPLVIREMLVGTICQAIMEGDFSNAIMLCRLSFSPTFNEGWALVLQTLLRTPKVCDPLVNELLLQALQDGINVESIHEEKRNSLLLVALCQTEIRIVLIETLLKHGAKVYIDKTDSDGRAPLHHAVQKSNVGAAKVLLECGASVGTTDLLGSTALMLACKQDVVDVAMVQLLLTHSPVDVVSRSDLNGRTPLHHAVQKNNLGVVKLLLECGADIGAADVEGCTALVLACKQDVVEVAMIQLLLGLGSASDRNEPDNKGWTPLHGVVSKGHEEIASLLLDSGADIHAVTADGASALLLACQHSQPVVNIAMVRMLLERGAVNDVKQSNKDGWTPLHGAVSKGHKEIASLLLDSGADIQAVTADGSSVLRIACTQDVDDVSLVRMLLQRGALSQVNKADTSRTTAEQCWTPLHCAVSKGHKEIASLLLESGADIHAVTANESSVLRIACSEKVVDVSLVRMLLERGALSQVNKPDKKGWTPLHGAVNKGHKEIASLLLDSGADIQEVTADESSVLRTACAQDVDDVSLVRMLLESGCLRQVNKPDKKGWTPLHGAVSKGHREIASLLLDSGADIHAVAADGSSVLRIACSGKVDDVSLVRMLLDRGAVSQVNKADSSRAYGWTPLHCAVSKGHKEVASLLLESGADIHALTADESSVFGIACTGKVDDVSLVRMLLERGRVGQVNKPDKEGWTPLHGAVSKGHEEIASLLLDCGADIQEVTADKSSVLWIACSGKDVDVSLVRMLLERGALSQINTPDERYGWTPLHAVVSKGHKEIASLLLDSGADIHTVTADGSSVLWIACSGKVDDVSLVCMLLERGAVSDINKPDQQYGWTPLHGAVKKGHKEVASLLLYKGADIQAMTADESSVLGIACTQDVDDASFVRMLLESGGLGHVNRADDGGWTPLHGAVNKGHKKIASLLLDSGADIHVLTADKSSVLRIACSEEDVDVSLVRMLLERGALSEINTPDERCWTPLHGVVSKGHNETASLLLDSGADIHAVTADGSSVLWIACSGKDVDVSLVRMLLERGAVSDINKPDKEFGWTPLQYALYEGHKEIASLLLQSGAKIDEESQRQLEVDALACREI